MHNKQLADQRNISQESREAIDEMHVLLEKLIDAYSLEIPYQEAEALVKSANKTLSDLWKFEYNERYDQWTPRLKQKAFELTWVGRSYKCSKTGVVVIITPEQAFERNLIAVGEGFVDLGVFQGYSRIVGDIEEIKE